MADTIAILGGNRIPFARSNGPYATASNQDMLTAALDGLVSRFGLQGERLGEVAAGGVLKHSRDFNLTRECVLGSALSPETPAYEVQQACGACCSTSTARARLRPGSPCWAGCDRGSWCRRSPGTPSRAPGCRWGSTRLSPRSAGASRAPSRTNW